MKRIDQDGISDISLRKELLEEELAKIRDTVNGRGELYLPYITEENGEITDEKTDRLIDELMDALKHYKKLKPYSHRPLTEEMEELYRCFLYCTIQGVAWSDNFCFGFFLFGEFEPARAFADIVNMAKDPETTAFGRRDDLLFQENGLEHWYSLRGGFFGFGDTVYQMVTGEEIYGTYSEEEKIRVDEWKRAEEIREKKINDELALEEARREGFATADEYFDYYAAMEDYMLDDEDWDDILREEEVRQEEVRQKEIALVKRMSNPDRYIRQYLRYRDLYFETEHDELPADIEHMVDIWLYERGLSAFSLGEAYGLVSHKVKQFPGMLKSEIRKARKMR